MEGEGCQTIRNDLRKPDNDDLHDSGCERSPATPSPSTSETSPSEKSTSSRNIITYDRVSWQHCLVSLYFFMSIYYLLI